MWASQLSRHDFSEKLVGKKCYNHMSKIYPIDLAFEILFVFKIFDHNRNEKKAHLLVMRLSVCILHFCSSARKMISVFLCRAAAFRSIYCSWRSWYMVWCRVRWSSASTSNLHCWISFSNRPSSSVLKKGRQKVLVCLSPGQQQAVKMTQ